MDDIQQQAFLYGFSGTLSAGKRPALFAAESSDLLRSLDGKTWLPCLPIQAGASAGVTCLASEPLEGQTVLCGLAGGILVSRDGGQNWASARVPSPPPMLTSLVLSPNFLLDGVAMAGTMQDGVLRSSDQGSSWTIWNFGLLDLEVLCLAVSPGYGEDEMIFAGTQTGIFRSTNGGRAWRECELPVGYEAVLCLAVADGRGEEKIVFAGTESRGMLLSSDGGDTWSSFAAPLEGEAVNALAVFPDAELGHRIAIVCGGQVWLRDGRNDWSARWPELAESGTEVTALHAPDGLKPDSQVWLGCLGGEILQRTLG